MRGLRNQRTVHELASLMRAQDLAVVFLAETWVDEDRLTKLCNDLHFDEKWVVPRITRANGLALLWKTWFRLTWIPLPSTISTSSSIKERMTHGDLLVYMICQKLGGSMRLGICYELFTENSACNG